MTMNFCLRCIIQLPVAQRGLPPQAVREGRGLKDVGQKYPSHLVNSYSSSRHTHMNIKYAHASTQVGSLFM